MVSMPNNIPYEQIAQDYLDYYKIQLSHLNLLPSAVGIVKVEIDQDGSPIDFFFVYANQALAELWDFPREQLIGHSFYQLFESGDKKWLYEFWETAYHGLSKELNDYSPEIDKYLSVSCYQPIHGYCGFVMKDVSSFVSIAKENLKNRLGLDIILEHSIDTVFDYDLERRTIYTSQNSLSTHQVFPTMENVPQSLVEAGLLEESSLPAMERCITQLESGSQTASCEVNIRISCEECYQWHNLVFSSYLEPYSGKRNFIGLLKNIHEQVVRQRALEEQAEQDGLTGIYNAVTGKQKIEGMLLKNSSKRCGHAMFLFDLDNFKSINDTYGHYNGDVALQCLATALSQSFRETDIVFRLGGDEFAAFISHSKESLEISKVCEIIVQRIRSLFTPPFPATISIGIAVCHHDVTSYDAFYKVSDTALYHAKRGGKNRHVILTLTPPH